MTCCTPRLAEWWLEAIAEAALDGDEDARRILGRVIGHWLAAQRAALWR